MPQAVEGFGVDIHDPSGRCVDPLPMLPLVDHGEDAIHQWLTALPHSSRQRATRLETVGAFG